MSRLYQNNPKKQGQNLRERKRDVLERNTTTTTITEQIQSEGLSRPSISREVYFENEKRKQEIQELEQRIESLEFEAHTRTRT